MRCPAFILFLSPLARHLEERWGAVRDMEHCGSSVAWVTFFTKVKISFVTKPFDQNFVTTTKIKSLLLSASPPRRELPSNAPPSGPRLVPICPYIWADVACNSPLTGPWTPDTWASLVLHGSPLSKAWPKGIQQPSEVTQKSQFSTNPCHAATNRLSPHQWGPLGGPIGGTRR